MRAAAYRETGKAADVLHVEEIPRPEPGPGEVLVRVYASGINPTDYKARSGAVPRPIDEFQIPHHDGAGVIEAVGPGVDPGRVGQRVWVFLAAAGRRWGTAAEWTVAPERQAVPLPDGAPMAALEKAAADVTAALAAGDLTGLPVHKFPLADIAAAHEAAESGVLGKVIVTP
jgi:NADPH:quinone reductase